jgi:hypothetical protein
MNKFNELYENVLNESKMDKAEKIINRAGFDRGVVQVHAKGVSVDGNNIKPKIDKEELKKLAKEVYDELISAGLKVKDAVDYKNFRSYEIEFK